MTGWHAALWYSWIDRRQRTAILALGDTTAVVLVVAVGLIEHGLDPLARPGYVLITATPFVLGWVLVGTLLGAYASVWWDRPVTGLLVLGPIWGLAAWTGAQIRATTLFPGGAQWVFVLVMVAAGLIALVAWRLVATVAYRRFWRTRDHCSDERPN